MVTRTNGNLVDGTDHSISTRNDPSLLNDSESLESMLPSKVLCTSDAAERATKELLLSNLENFIAVGVLEPFTGSQDFSKSMKSPDYPLTEVDLLEQAAWIRTIPLENNGDPERSAVRVYVLPEDIGRAVVPRSSVPLHRALKVVMSKLNVSSGAWDGHVTPFSKPLLQPSEEDESLFYIFNTLESPAPNPNSVCDPWARTVMEDVLAGSTNSDENFSLVGLKTLLYPYQRRSAALMIQKEYAPGEFLDPRLREFRGPTGHIYYYDKEEGIVTRHPRLYSGVREGEFLPHFQVYLGR
ncbi:hypothetical protein LOY92_004789 [Ophidiomyces ophidiicola]|nr:hypothetical protein LOY92_004789 [Ophidiomyces ophidiicola]